MKDFIISEMNLSLDKPKITNWENDFAGTYEYNRIEWFILENRLFKDLSKLIESQHETYEIDEFYELKRAFSIKDKSGEILGFILCSAGDVSDQTSELYIQYIVLNPANHHKGFGTEVLTEFFKNIKNYIGFTPVDVHALVHRHNFNSINLFKKFGFDFARRSRSYVRADGDFYTINKILNQNTDQVEKIWINKIMI